MLLCSVVRAITESAVYWLLHKQLHFFSTCLEKESLFTFIVKAQAAAVLAK